MIGLDVGVPVTTIGEDVGTAVVAAFGEAVGEVVGLSVNVSLVGEPVGAEVELLDDAPSVPLDAPTASAYFAVAGGVTPVVPRSLPDNTGNRSPKVSTYWSMERLSDV